MKISAQIGERLHEVVVERENGIYVVEIDGVVHRVDAQRLEDAFYSILYDGRSYEVSVERKGDDYHVRHGATGRVVRLTDPGRRARQAQAAADGVEKLISAMPGKVVRVLVAPGDDVTAGQGVVVVEAMKMENEIAAGKDGKVRAVSVEPGQTVEAGALLAEIE